MHRHMKDAWRHDGGLPALMCWRGRLPGLLDALAGRHVGRQQALAPAQLPRGFPDGVHAGRQPLVRVAEIAVQLRGCSWRTGPS